MTDCMCGTADFSPRGVRGRRLSGRGRSGRLQHHSDQYSGAPLYTVVTMDPNDEVSLLQSQAYSSLSHVLHNELYALWATTV